jgi:hypothetical protein
MLNSDLKNNWLLLFLLFYCFFSTKVFSQGDLLITPNRVVFEGRKQKEMLNLLNTGIEATTYSISFVQRRMNEDGSFNSIETPDEGQLFADPYLRIYPRMVTLDPGEGQVVMLQFKRKPEMQDGEYRSHLYFRSEKDYTPLGNEKVDSTKTLSVQLIPIFGISIPVIIRLGSNTTINSGISNLKIERTSEPLLSFKLLRSGDFSIYGNILVDFIPDNGKPFQIGAVKGVAVYTNITERQIIIKLDSKLEDLKNGTIRVKYTTREDVKHQVVFAEGELRL